MMEPSRSRSPGPRLRPGGPTDPPRISVTVAEHGAYAVIAVAGEIDIMTGTDLRDPLHELIRRGIVHHIIDLREVTFLDSTGLGILVGERKRLRDRGGSVRAVCGPGLAGRIVKLTAVDRIIEVHDSVASAAAALESAETL